MALDDVLKEIPDYVLEDDGLGFSTSLDFEGYTLDGAHYIFKQGDLERGFGPQDGGVLYRLSDGEFAEGVAQVSRVPYEFINSHKLAQRLRRQSGL